MSEGWQWVEFMYRRLTVLTPHHRTPLLHIALAASPALLGCACHLLICRCEIRPGIEMRPPIKADRAALGGQWEAAAT